MLQTNWKKNTAVFMGCQATSLFGSSLVQYAIFWHITLSTQSGTYTTLYILFGVLPTFFLSPMGGVWADRYNRKHLIAIADACIAVVTLALALLFLAGYSNIWLIFIIAALRALGTAVQQPAINAMIPDMVPEEHLTRVNGINSTMQSVIFLASPAVSGLLLSFLPINLIFFVDVVTAALSIAILLPFFVSPMRKVPVNSEGYFADLRMGVSYIASVKYLRAFFLFFAALMFVAAAPAFLSPLQVARSFGPDFWRLTVIEVTFSAGMVVGGLVMASWGGWKNRITTMGIASVIMGLCAFCFGFHISFWVYIGLITVIGVAVPLYNTAFTVFLQENIDPAYRGRTFSVMMMINSSVMPMAMLVMGPLADRIDIEWIMLATGAITTLVALVFLLNKELHSKGEKAAEG